MGEPLNDNVIHDRCTSSNNMNPIRGDLDEIMLPGLWVSNKTNVIPVRRVPIGSTTPDRQTTCLIGLDQVTGLKIIPMNGLQSCPKLNRVGDRR
jgi:hypothetical protein